MAGTAPATARSSTMPERTCFDSVEEYYSTLYHELTHATGHPSRLNRPSLADFERFGDHNYSREELVAEMGAAFLAGYCGIGNRTIDNLSLIHISEPTRLGM